jgi:Kef-type K+ transport system membrane component KefB
MSTESILIDCVYFLAATLTFVPLFRLAGLGSTLGYLTAGLALGPDLLGIIDNSNFIFKLGDFGIILLLFVIGLELSPRRLSQLKSRIFIDGSLQFIFTTALVTFILLQLNYNFSESFILAAAFSLSSTAFVLFYLKDSKQLTLSYGQSSFGILLFQDLIIIPLLILIPFMETGATQVTQIDLTSVLGTFAGLAIIIAFGHFALKPLVSMIHKKNDHEVFSAACLLIVLGTSLLITKLGLSMALGAFMAGIFLSNFEFKKEVENVILPFKGMLLGTFFMSFGLQFKISFIQENIVQIAVMTSIILIAKSIVLTVVGKFRLKDMKKGAKLALIMSQGGEFGFVVIASAMSHGILTSELSKLATTSILFTLFLAPILSKVSEFIGQQEKNQEAVPDNLFVIPRAPQEPISIEEAS